MKQCLARFFLRHLYVNTNAHDVMSDAKEMFEKQLAMVIKLA